MQWDMYSDIIKGSLMVGSYLRPKPRAKVVVFPISSSHCTHTGALALRYLVQSDEAHRKAIEYERIRRRHRHYAFGPSVDETMEIDDYLEFGQTP